MRTGIQEHEPVRLHYWSGRNDIVHLLRRRHGGRILQDVEREPAQRLEGALRDDLSERVIRVSEVSGEEKGERSKPFVYRLAHVLKCGLGAFGEKQS